MSLISTSGINTAFPVPGVDNSSQGFRENFAGIVAALTTATSEITALELNTVKVNAANNFNFVGSISGAKIKNSGYAAINTGSITGDLDFAVASFHKVAISTSTTFLVANWPAISTNTFAQLRVEIAPTTSTSVPINFSGGVGVIKKESSVVLPYVSTSTNSTVWDLWTTDGGATVFLKFVGGPYA